MDWQEFINWISNYNNLIPSVQVFVAGVTAFATIVLVYVTWVLACLTEKKPFVVCNTELRSHGFRISSNLVIKNTGNATAFNIQAKISCAKQKPNEKPPEHETEFTLFISLLLPGQSIPHKILDELGNPKKFDVIVSWASKPKGRRSRNLTYTVDNSDKLIGQWQEGSLGQIAEELAKGNAYTRFRQNRD